MLFAVLQQHVITEPGIKGIPVAKAATAGGPGARGVCAAPAAHCARADDRAAQTAEDWLRGWIGVLGRRSTPWQT